MNNRCVVVVCRLRVASKLRVPVFQRAQIARYRDRWQKLKENAKRKQKMARDGALPSEQRANAAEADHSD